MLTTVEEEVQCCLTMFAALGKKNTYGTANTGDGIIPGVAVTMAMMQVLIATDIRYSSMDSGLIGMYFIIYFTVFM